MRSVHQRHRRSTDDKGLRRESRRQRRAHQERGKAAARHADNGKARQDPPPSLSSYTASDLTRANKESDTPRTLPTTFWDNRTHSSPQKRTPNRAPRSSLHGSPMSI
eukprot:8526186-Pyramimonas_sp.AAC.1